MSIAMLPTPPLAPVTTTGPRAGAWPLCSMRWIASAAVNPAVPSAIARNASSDAGNVLVTVPLGGEYRVDATTDSGDIKVAGVIRNDRSRRSITATANAGDVTVLGRGAG